MPMTFYVRIDKTRKIPVTVFIRALGLGSDEEIINYFGEDERIRATIEKDPCKTTEEALLRCTVNCLVNRRRLKAQTHINGLFSMPAVMTFPVSAAINTIKIEFGRSYYRAAILPSR